MKRLPICVLAALAACGGPQGTGGTPEISADPERNGTELVFELARHDRSADGTQLLSARGLLEGRPVGFDLELAAWRENPPGYINMSTWECRAHWRSQGPPSDELLRFLDTLYATHQSPSRMVPSLELQAFSPWKDPGDFQDGPAKFVLLFPIPFEEGAEAWIEVDAARARIYLREKDPRYRRALVGALTAPDPAP